MSFCSLLRAPSSVSFVDFLHAALMAPAFERGIEPLVQDVDPLLFAHKLRRQHEDVRIPMLARQLGYLLIPCQRRTHVGETVGRVRHAQTCTTSKHPALHFSTTHRLGHRLGVVRIVVRRVESFWPNIDRLIAELLELVHEAVLEFEPHVIRADENALRQSSVSPWLSQQSVSPPTGPPLCSSACSPRRQYRTPSESCRRSLQPCCARAPSSSPRARHSRSRARPR